MMNYAKIVEDQRKIFNANGTKDLAFRKKLLQILQSVLKDNEAELYEAIHKDLGKSEVEAYSTELSLIYSEIRYFLKNLKQLAKPRSVSTNIINQLGSSEIHYEPYGTSLIIGAWNYPYQLSLLPAINALAAGNTVILKPSEVAANTAAMMQKVINENFPPEVFHVILGGVKETTELLKLRFDKIFFTGNPTVGKIVYEAAAKHLTPVTLELGGKSPAIVTPSANLKVAAKRIVWGKFLNAGQTCLAPDYLYVEESVKDELLTTLKQHIEEAAYEEGSENYTRIINEKHFDRLKGLVDNKKVYYGGKMDKDKLFIEPTIMDKVDWKDEVMQEEIFGPILPVLSYTDFEETLKTIKEKEKPLSAYLFSGDGMEKKQFLEDISFGGGCINDTIMHITNPELPFGGVGNSGIGSYHGEYGFETFSHRKSIIKKATWGEPNLKYPPYSDSKKKWLKRIM